MTPQGQPATPALQALAGNGTLAGSWILDPARSEVRLESRHTWGLLPVHGVFRQVTGNGEVTAAGQVTGTLTIAAGSVDTKNNRRDKDLRSAKIFDAANHPDITYTVDGIQPADDGVRVTGSLTVRGPHPPALFRREGLRRRGRGRTGRRGPGQPGGLRPDIQPAAHGVAEHHHHCPRHVHPPISQRRRTQRPCAGRGQRTSSTLTQEPRNIRLSGAGPARSASWPARHRIGRSIGATATPARAC